MASRASEPTDVGDGSIGARVAQPRVEAPVLQAIHSMQPTQLGHEKQMLQSHPRGPAFEETALLACIRACLECATACNTCADACLGEQDPKSLVRCIRLNNDCADQCAATARILERQSEPSPELVKAVLNACAEVCRVCGDECEQHAAHMEHCRICAESCRGCANACRRLSAPTVRA